MSVGISDEAVVAVLYQPASEDPPFSALPKMLVPADVTNDYDYLSCSVAGSPLAMQCVADEQDTFYLVPDNGGDSSYFYLANTGDADAEDYSPVPAVPVTLIVVPLEA